MTTQQHPITRSELREELADLRGEFVRHYATKADLAGLENRLVKWMFGILGTAGLSLLGTIISIIVLIMTM